MTRRPDIDLGAGTATCPTFRRTSSAVGTRTGRKFLRDDGLWQLTSGSPADDALRLAVDDLEHKASGLAISRALRWSVTPQLSDGESPESRRS